MLAYTMLFVHIYVYMTIWKVNQHSDNSYNEGIFFFERLRFFFSQKKDNKLKKKYI